MRFKVHMRSGEVLHSARMTMDQVEIDKWTATLEDIAEKNSGFIAFTSMSGAKVFVSWRRIDYVEMHPS